MSTTIALTDAKATLSSVVKKVSESGNEYVITIRDKPAAMIVPIPKPAPTKLKAMGMLAKKRPVASREEEKASYAEALEEKYAHSA